MLHSGNITYTVKLFNEQPQCHDCRYLPRIRIAVTLLWLGKSASDRQLQTKISKHLKDGVVGAY